MPKKTQRVPRIIEFSAEDPELNEKLEELSKKIHADSPGMSERLGKILKRRGKWSLKQFLKDLGYAGKVPQDKLGLYMDWLITQRHDMKDSHDPARRRLREFFLSQQDESEKTKDYLKYVEGKEYPDDCGDCLWFMVPPEGETNTCVSRGSRGIDKACYGFIKKHEKKEV